MKIKVEDILDDAEIAAVYFRALVDKGVPMQAAIQMTSSYVFAKKTGDTLNEGPSEPWRDKP